jgi:hypothetical protein
MEWRNAHHLPAGLPNLLYRLTPEDVRHRVTFIVLPRRDRPHIGGRTEWDELRERWEIRLYPTVARRHSRNGWAPQRLAVAYVALHEVGHAVHWASTDDLVNRLGYDAARPVVERWADQWARDRLEPLCRQARVLDEARWSRRIVRMLARQQRTKQEDA